VAVELEEVEGDEKGGEENSKLARPGMRWG
jgi:hypothetical protein